MPKHNNKFGNPADARYKAENHLKRNKIRRIMRAQKVDEKTAEALWESSKTK